MFINKTNILDIVRETTDPNNEAVIYRMYLQFLKEDESIFIPSLNISASLVKILMKHKKFCDKCKQILESLTPRAPTVNNNEKEENLHMNKTNYSISTFPNNITEGFSETPCRKELEQMQIDEHW